MHDLAVFVATVSDLINAETSGQLENIHNTMGLSMTGHLSSADADAATEAFLVAYLLGDWVHIGTLTKDIASMKQRLQLQYPDYPETYMWMQDFKRTYDLEQMPRRNPLVKHTNTFDTLAALAVVLSHRLRSF